MFYPNLRQEKKLQKTGFQLIAGIDEVGRGAWAGPLLAAAVILNPKVKIKGIKDSKLLRSPERKRLAGLIEHSALAWAIGLVNQNLIDEIGLTAGNLLAMELAVKSLKLKPNYVISDGIFPINLKIPGHFVIDGDYKVKSIAAASIIAKVKRDEIMDQLDEDFPQYGFKQHKGYGTPHHHNMLIRHGISRLHRKSFKPISSFIEQGDL